jgi:hypothetical protein
VCTRHTIGFRVFGRCPAVGFSPEFIIRGAFPHPRSQLPPAHDLHRHRPNRTPLAPTCRSYRHCTRRRRKSQTPEVRHARPSGKPSTPQSATTRATEARCQGARAEAPGNAPDAAARHKHRKCATPHHAANLARHRVRRRVPPRQDAKAHVPKLPALHRTPLQVTNTENAHARPSGTPSTPQSATTRRRHAFVGGAPRKGSGRS